MLNNKTLEGFSRQMKVLQSKYDLNQYLVDIKAYWKAKRAKQRIKKPQPKFTEAFISAIKAESKQVRFYVDRGGRN